MTLTVNIFLLSFLLISEENFSFINFYKIKYVNYLSLWWSCLSYSKPRQEVEITLSQTPVTQSEVKLLGTKLPISSSVAVNNQHNSSSYYQWNQITTFLILSTSYQEQESTSISNLSLFLVPSLFDTSFEVSLISTISLLSSLFILLLNEIFVQYETTIKPSVCYLVYNPYISP